jgi:predicted permease
MTRFAWGSVAHAIHVRKEEGMMRGFAGDLAFTIRSLLRRPAFLLLSLCTLGVGIGSAVMVFSVGEAVLLREPPLPEPERLVGIYSTNPAIGMETFSVSYPDFRDWTARADLFESASMYMQLERDISDDGDPERLVTAGVYSGYFETLGTRATLGRLLDDGDQEPAAERTVVLSHELWRRRFGSDPQIVGRTVRLDAVPHTVVGVAAEGEGWPGGMEAWIPLRFGATPPEWVDRRSNHTWQVVARLAPGVDAGHASEQIRVMASTWYTANESASEQTIEATAIRFRTLKAGSGAAAGLVVMGVAVFLVLLIACLNQANILLVNAWTRAREISLRAALGAGRSRLITLLMGESLVLALAGAALGLGLAWLGLRGVELMVPQGGADDIEPRFNGIVLGVTLVLALGTAVVAGLVPALRASRTSMAAALSEGGAGAGAGRSAARLRRGLVVLEMTLSVVLLSGAALTIRTFQAQVNAETGLNPESILIFDVRLPTARYPDLTASNLFFDEALQRLEATPGITTAAVGSSLPLGASRSNLMRVFLPEGAPEPPAGPDFTAQWIEVDADYFDALGVRMLRGRGVTGDDVADGPPVIVVNETMARRISPDQEVLGRRIRSWRDENLLREVVGVVPDIQLGGIAGRDQPAVFVPRAQGQFMNLAFMVRTTGDPGAVAPAVRTAMAEMDPNVALEGLRTLRDAHRDDLAGVRIVTLMFSVFGGLALVLATTGVYGLVALSVAQRTREIGIRMALGGSHRAVLGSVLGEGTRLGLVGLAVGLALSAAFAMFLASRIVGIPSLNAGTMGVIAGMLVGAVLVASLVPALRATRVDPVRALRAD